MITSVQIAMTKKLITIPSDASVQSANHLMEEKRVRHLVVVDVETNSAVGVLSQRQLQLSRLSPHTLVALLMSSPIITVDPTTPLRLAIFKMLENKISALVVADSQDEVLGIVTTDDLLWYLAHILSNENETPALISENTKVTLGAIMNQLSQAGL